MGEISKEALEEPKREPFVKCPTNTQQLFQTLGGIFSHLLDKFKCFEINKMLPLQAEQPEMRISLFKIKLLLSEIAKGLLKLTEDFLWLCASWIQSQTCYCGRSNLKARKEEDFSKLIMAKNILKEVETWKSKIISLYPKCQNSRTFIISDIILCRQKVLFWHLTFSQNTQYCVPTILRGQ